MILWSKSFHCANYYLNTSDKAKGKKRRSEKSWHTLLWNYTIFAGTQVTAPGWSPNVKWSCIKAHYLWLALYTRTLAPPTSGPIYFCVCGLTKRAYMNHSWLFMVPLKQLSRRLYDSQVEKCSQVHACPSTKRYCQTTKLKSDLLADSILWVLTQYRKKNNVINTTSPYWYTADVINPLLLKI